MWARQASILLGKKLDFDQYTIIDRKQVDNVSGSEPEPARVRCVHGCDAAASGRGRNG